MSAVVAVVPAHNEESVIADTLGALMAQSRPPDRIIVSADNCTDATVATARGLPGVEVFETSENVHKKAGNLNQVLAWLLPSLAPHDAVVVQDADSQLAPGFIAAATRSLTPDAGAVGGVFYGAGGAGLLGLLQRNEFARYGRSITRRDGTVRVLSGTASVFLVSTLRKVRDARRSGRIPGGSGFYDTLSLTEDNEITLALRTVGFDPVSPPECTVTTEVMPTVPKLWNQRVRWQRGALENLRNYGWTKVTAPYILRQGLAALSAASLTVYLAFMTSCLALGVSLAPSTLGIALALVFTAERTVTVRRAGLRSVLVAAALVVELAYDMFQNVVYGACLVGALRRTRQQWHAT
jgi:cellulose synthase/poly-beta-1,6-N-acetylglucosamine synthase-like glycosyltransferase